MIVAILGDLDPAAQHLFNLLQTSQFYLMRLKQSHEAP